MSFQDTVRSVSISNVDTFDEGPCRIYWRNGDRKIRTGGRFYTKADQYNDELTEPWVASDLYPGEDGYEASMIRLAVIGFRQQAFRRVDDRYQWLPQWESGAQLYTEMLTFAEGIEEPVVWVCKGLIGKATVGKGGILSTYRAGLLREAERQVGKKLPLWSFWLPVSTQLDAHGRIVYTPTGFGSNAVTLPALHLPHNDMQANIDELFVGNELYKWGDELRAEYDGWFKARRGESEPELASVAVTEEPSGMPTAEQARSSEPEDSDLFGD